VPIIVLFARLLVGSALALAAAQGAAAPELQLSQARAVVSLTQAMATEALPVQMLPDPDAFWARPLPRADALPRDRWKLRSGERLVGRVTLHGSREREEFVVLVPSARIDEVQVWYRHREGDSWKGALAGDRVPLSRWPLVGAFPVFRLQVGEKPVDLILTAVNDGPLTTQVLILADSAYHEVQTRQAEWSGLIAGLGLMVVVVCVIAATTLRRAAHWLMVGVAAWGLFSIICVNGDTAIWLTPDWPEFNDGSKHMTSVILSGLMLSLIVQTLDLRFLGRARLWLALAAPAAAVAYAAVQALYLPNSWQPVGALAWALLMIVLALALCAASALAGGRYVRLVVPAALCYAGAAVVGVMDFDLVATLDFRSAASATLVFSSVLLIRHALFSRERYGRDVLGRAAVSANRDPLTALLSYSGFQLAYDEALLRQGTQRGGVWVILFLLPGLERSSADHGFVLTERALVRFAACLQSVLGDGWAIGRLSKTRFACVNRDAVGVEHLNAVTTQVLASCSRLSDPLGPVSDFDLRIAFTRCQPSPAGLKGLLHQLEEAARALDATKRIALV